MGALTCVSDIAQSQIIDRVYSNSWLCKVLRNCYFVIKLIFESPLFKELYFYMFSRGLLFQKMLFCTANFFFNFNFFFYLSFSNQHTNTDVFTLKLPSGVQSGCTTQIIFLLNTMNKNFASNLLSQGSIEQEYLSENIKSFWGVKWKYKFQYWISVLNQLNYKTINLILAIPHFTLFS